MLGFLQASSGGSWLVCWTVPAMQELVHGLLTSLVILPSFSCSIVSCCSCAPPTPSTCTRLMSSNPLLTNLHPLPLSLASPGVDLSWQLTRFLHASPPCIPPHVLPCLPRC